MKRPHRPGGVLAAALLSIPAIGVPVAHSAGPGTPAFVVDGGTQVRLSGATALTLDCDLRNAGLFLPDPGSAVVLTGYGSPLLLGVGGFADLTLALHGTAVLGQNATVAGALTLGTGRLSIAGHDLGATVIAGGSAVSYVMTPDTLGRLVRFVDSTAPVAFPVGHASYDPIRVRTGAGGDVFRVAVLDSPATTGLLPASALTRAWAVTHANPPGVNGDLTMTVQWNADEEGPQFDRSLDPTVGAWAWRWVNGAWAPQANVRRSDNGVYPAVDSLVTPDAGLWTLAGIDGLIDAGPPPAGTPRALELAPAFPNPSRGAATVRFGLPRRTHVRLDLYSILGERVATLVDGERAAGWHLVRYEDARLRSGVYFLSIQAGPERRSGRLVVMR